MIVPRPGQKGGATANSTTLVARAFGSSVEKNSLILIMGAKQTPSSDAFVVGDCTKSAGTATIDTPVLDSSIQLAETSGTPQWFSAGVWSCLVTAAGSLTMQVGGSVAGSFLTIGTDELLGRWGAARLAGSNSSSTDTDNTASANTGNATAAREALYAACLSVASGTDPYTMTPESLEWSVVYEQRAAATNLPSSHINMVTVTGAVRRGFWTITNTNTGWAAAVAAYQEVLFGTLARRRRRGRSRDGIGLRGSLDIKRWFREHAHAARLPLCH
jgi:hypothetical protein